MIYIIVIMQRVLLFIIKRFTDGIFCKIIDMHDHNGINHF